jgi:hypothetical protein
MSWSQTTKSGGTWFANWESGTKIQFLWGYTGTEPHGHIILIDNKIVYHRPVSDLGITISGGCITVF